MNILILGSGGREHAFAWKLKQSSLCKQIYIAPGNSGTESIGINVQISVNDFNAIAEFSINHNIGMIVCGPEDPLVNGLRDYIKSNIKTKQINFIGPDKHGAMLEGSKDFSKKFMIKHHIPTAKYISVTKENLSEGKAYIQKMTMPVVLKADGLAAGKGVLIIDTVEDACDELDKMIHGLFGAASSTVLIEEFLTGIEVSVFVLTDGENYLILPEAKDYKRIGEGDTGLNTGGMGAVSPVGFADSAFMNKVEQQIVKPTIDGLKKENINYIGFVFIGLMNVGGEPYVIEYNCRMGDPETEVVLPRIENDLVELFLATDNRELYKHQIQTSNQYCTTVFLVSGGYPGDYIKHKQIKISQGHELLFHAGAINENGSIYTNGGRVMACSALGDTLEGALNNSYTLVSHIEYEGKYYRKDIGKDL